MGNRRSYLAPSSCDLNVTQLFKSTAVAVSISHQLIYLNRFNYSHRGQLGQYIIQPICIFFFSTASEHRGRFFFA